MASPRGGVVPLDPASLKPAGQNEASVERMLGDATLQQRLAHSLPLASLQGQRFDAVFMPGGHGTMWDLPQDPHVIATVQNTLAAGRWVASVCHGYCGLLDTRLSDGSLLVAGRRLTGFSWLEERLAGVAGAHNHNVIPGSVPGSQGSTPKRTSKLKSGSAQQSAVSHQPLKS